MFSTARRTIPLLGLVLSLNASGGDSPAAASPSHTATRFTAAQEATIDWAVGLFDEAGLSLPGIDFVLDTTVEPCHGRRGWYSGADGRPVIHICTHEGGPVSELLILHELAHAWDGHTLTDERRTAFLDWRGLHQWWGTEHEHWGEYGPNRRPRPLSGASSTDRSGPPKSRPPTTTAATCGPPTSCSPADHPSTAIRTAAGGPSRTTSRDRPESGRTQPFRLRLCSEHEFDGEGCAASRILRDLGHVSPGQRSPVELARRRVGRSRLWGPGRLSHGDRDDEIGCWWQASQVVLIVAAALAGWFPGHSAAVTARSDSGTPIIDCSANSGSAETRRGGTHRVV
jgi:hypothetical protein